MLVYLVWRALYNKNHIKALSLVLLLGSVLFVCFGGYFRVIGQKEVVKILETLEGLRKISVILSLENEFSEVDIMKRVICPICNSICMKYGKNKSGSQRWFCKECSSITTQLGGACMLI